MFDGKYLDWNQKRIKGIIDHFGYNFIFQKKILDLGCGHGDISGALYRLGGDITAVDSRQEHLKITGKKFPGIKTIKADLDRGWPFIGKQFDIILDLDLMCHLTNFESHLKSVCSSTSNLILETAVCDSEDPFKSVLVAENKNVYDLSVNGQGCRPSIAAVERVLADCGFSFERTDLAKFNSGTYVYNWTPKNDGNHSLNQRMIWFATKSPHLQASPFIPPTEVVSLPFNVSVGAPKLQNTKLPLPGLVAPKDTFPVISGKLNQKPKVALCISGHLRTFESNFKSVKEHILDRFDCDVFIHTWDVLGLSYRPGDSNLHITETRLVVDKLQKLYQPKKLVVEKTKQFPVTPIMHQRSREHRDIPGILSMFYKVEECNKLRKEYETEQNINYDFVIRFRGDLWMEEPFPIDARTTSNHLYLPIYGNFGGACDQLAFGSPQMIDKYCSLYSNIERCLRSGATLNPEKLLLFHLEMHNTPIVKVSVRYVIRRANGLVQDNMLLERAWGMIR